MEEVIKSGNNCPTRAEGHYLYKPIKRSMMKKDLLLK